MSVLGLAELWPATDNRTAVLVPVLAAACCAAGGAAVPAIVRRLPRPGGLAAGDPGPDYAALGAATGLGPGCAVLGGAAGLLLGNRLGADPFLPAWCLLVIAGLVLSWVDVHEHRLPDAVVRPTAVLLLLLTGVAAVAAGDLHGLLRAAVGGTSSAGLLLVAALARPGGMGLGDVKLAGLTGWALGWRSWTAPLVGLLTGLVIGGLIACVLLVAGRAHRRTPIPLGPALLLGALIAALLPGGS